MSGTAKTRRSVPLSETVAVDTRQVNVVVEGLDAAAIGGSFAIHLLKDGESIASRFFFQPSSPAPAQSPGAVGDTPRFEFALPIDALAGGQLSVRITPNEGAAAAGAAALQDLMKRATLSIYLSLESD